ncbi:MAG TPA: hypothetical protein PLY54_05105 [Ottowia sp.]|nr:hypothetical protein [Ottowia sp.]
MTTGTATTTIAVAAPATPWLCRRCARPQSAFLRLGFVRHGLTGRAGRRHDHWP